MEKITGLVFILSTLLLVKYLTVLVISFLSNPPKKIKMRYYKSIAVDEIIIFFTISYFLTYLIF